MRCRPSSSAQLKNWSTEMPILSVSAQSRPGSNKWQTALTLSTVNSYRKLLRIRKAVVRQVAHPSTRTLVSQACPFVRVFSRQSYSIECSRISSHSRMARRSATSTGDAQKHQNHEQGRHENPHESIPRSSPFAALLFVSTRHREVAEKLRHSNKSLGQGGTRSRVTLLSDRRQSPVCA